MDMILSTPGQWYLDYLDNGLWSALQNFFESMGISIWGFVAGLVAIVAIVAVAIFVPFPELE